MIYFLTGIFAVTILVFCFFYFKQIKLISILLNTRMQKSSENYLIN